MANFRGPVVSNANLLFYYDAANFLSYNQTSATWNDLSGLNNNSTLSGTGFSTNFQGAITMLGAGTITLSNNASISAAFANSSFTIILTVNSKSDASPRSSCPMYIQAANPVAGSLTQGWAVGEGQNTTFLNIECCDGVNYNTAQINHGVAATTIYHRAFVVDRTNGTTTNYFVNGSLVGIASSSAVTGALFSSGSFVFGNTAGWRFLGDIYFIQAYSRALSTAEVQQNFLAYRSRFSI